MAKIKTPVIDKNGKSTHVHKNAEKPTNDRELPSPTNPANDKTWLDDIAEGDMRLVTRELLHYGWPSDDETIEDLDYWDGQLIERGYFHVTLKNGDGETLFLAHPETNRYVRGNATPDGVHIQIWRNDHDPVFRSVYPDDSDYMDAIEQQFDVLWNDKD